MIDFLSDNYLWIKALHIISVISWMAGMLYLPRLFVYHADSENGSTQSETFKIMERRLMRGIINPSMVLAFIFGGCLLFIPGIVEWSEIWIWIKLTMVLIMTAIHGMLSRYRRNFEKDQNEKSAKFYRIINEVPALLMLVIVIMVVVKPFDQK